ncbi:MAG: isoleucine--tRNA ligase [Candidatus Nezhaarchaeales archaeon]
MPSSGIGLLPREYYPQRYEEEVLRWWKEERIYERVKGLRKSGPKYYFLDGPPYVTNPIHVGTAWNKIIKDAIIRQRRMLGYNVRDQPGYDMHGLPIEVMVERKLGFSSKKDIETKFGVARFIEECRNYALSNLQILTRQFLNLGVWMDWDNPYMTITNEYMEAVWWLVKRAYEKGLLARKERVVHWCPRCETVLAGYEVTEEYRLVKDPSVYVKFPLTGRKDEYLLIWTTTPWTLPANVAVMVNPEYDYVKVRVEGETYILAKARVEAVFKPLNKSYEVLEVFPGSRIEGVRYESPLAEEVPKQAVMPRVVVLSREYVTLEEGTGCVHSATGHGEEDFNVGLKYGLPVFCPVNERGVFDENAGKYAGKYIYDANAEIIKDLARKGLLLRHEEVEHRYPHCWRCKTPLILRATDQWFIEVSALKEKLLEEIDKVTWVPEWAGYVRFKKWVQEARDWVISRQRYWGVPLPIWICLTCGSYEVIGSLSELRSKALNPEAILDLHRPWIDEVKLRCKCGGEMRRVPDVLDVWMDSGVASWACLGFPSKEEEFRFWWPADQILEGHDQTRGWFYTLLVTSVVGFDRAPYNKVLVHGFSLDQQGRAMHKSLGNIIYPEEVIERYGRDALRLYELGCTTWEDLRFTWSEVEDAHRLLNILWNVAHFASLYMNLDRFSPKDWPLEKVKAYLQPEDLWLLSRLQKLIIDVSLAFEELHLHEAVKSISTFIAEDLSRWYIRLIRRRTWIEKDDPVKLAAYVTLHQTLSVILRLLAPITPFITEKIYRSVVAPSDPSLPLSVHMCDFPKPDTSFINDSLEKDMDQVRSIVEAVLSARQQAKLKLRYPVSKILISATSSEVEEAVKTFNRVILDQANAKEVIMISASEEAAFKEVKVLPNFSRLGPKFRGKAILIADALKGVNGREFLGSIREKGYYELATYSGTFKLLLEDVEVKEELPSYLSSARFKGGTVYVDTRLHKELIAEGLAREIVRRLQEMRKELDLKVDAYIDARVITPDEEAATILRSMEDYVKREVRVVDLTITTSREEAKTGHSKEWDINGETYILIIKERTP